MINQLWNKFNRNSYQKVVYRNEQKSGNELTRIGGQIYETSIPERQVGIINKPDID